MSISHPLPAGMVVLERGWLSANNVVFAGPGPTAVVDTGYATHAEQTLRLVQGALGSRSLDLLLNTHLHSDHCGGNAALQKLFPAARTWIPPGLAEHVKNWDPVALTYVPTGQQCPAFSMTGILTPGTRVTLGEREWEIHAAPGHDPHSVVLFEAVSRCLISADALWENGFGVVFQELEGENAFVEVGHTLDLIESLEPRIVIPGHGKQFSDVGPALANARRRLESFQRDPLKHARHAAKVLLKFKLLELQRVDVDDLVDWAEATPYFGLLHRRWFHGEALASWVRAVSSELANAGAARFEGSAIVNA